MFLKFFSFKLIFYFNNFVLFWCVNIIIIFLNDLNIFLNKKHFKKQLYYTLVVFNIVLTITF